LTSTLSYREQGCSAEQVDLETERVYAELRILNADYEAKFGHKFVVFVAGRPKSAIVPILRERLANPNPAQELETGLSEMMKIARNRLTKLFSVIDVKK